MLPIELRLKKMPAGITRVTAVFGLWNTEIRQVSDWKAWVKTRAWDKVPRIWE